MNDIEQSISFRRLLEACPRIEIPLIQRDYAQGRESESEVRDHFLGALHDALTRSSDQVGYSLNLDFVYGSNEGDASGKFLPLDGQQRLTTLFLLHWYLGWRDDHLSDAQGMLYDGHHSRFTYKVRPSSAEFFDALTRFEPNLMPDSVLSIRGLLEDQPWFFLSWRLDPTIQSALVMLEAIHKRFKSSAGLYERLIDGMHPAITFQLLPLEHFGLTDDLYIKMNARGKPLTPFESFKARFEELLRELFPHERRKLGGGDVSIAEFFERRMDTRWADFFWVYKNPKTNTFDAAVMNLILAVVRVSLAPSPDPASNFSTDTAQLRTRGREWTFASFHENGWLTKAFAQNLICVLEAWSKGSGKLAPVLFDNRCFDELSFFEKACRDPSGIDYLQMIQFAALMLHLREYDGKVGATSASEWMRVLRNLAVNSDIERPEQFGRALAGLHKLVPSSADILKHLTAGDIGQIGFSPQQVAEEVLKAQLLLSNSGWRARIDRAEEHGYFTGQIGFLLDFCGVKDQLASQAISEWDAQVHADLQAAFDTYLEKAQVMFDDNGLSTQRLPPELHLWKRALLAVGNYMDTIGSNRSFLTNPARNPDSWKRFLRDGSGRQYLKTLWDQFDAGKDVAPQLSTVIASANGLEPWRALVVQYPEIISYCGQQKVRWPWGYQAIYLLSKTQMNGTHAELFSYALYLELATSELGLLKCQHYRSVTSSEEEPCAVLTFDRAGRKVHFRIKSTKGAFRIFVDRADLELVPEVGPCLRDQAGFKDLDTAVIRDVPREDIHAILQELTQILALLPP